MTDAHLFSPTDPLGYGAEGKEENLGRILHGDFWYGSSVNIELLEIKGLGI